MAANRPKRQKPEHPLPEHDNKLWSLKEKRRLQRALLKYSPHDIENISKLIESKKVTEIRAYLDKMEEKLKFYAENRPKEIIEWWTTLASDLISCEAKDYSEVLSNVMSIIANLEERNNVSALDEDRQPDYSAIYKYIATILTGQDLPFLGKLESAVVLDLMHNLIDTIRTHDTSKQQEIMLQKYQLLNTSIDLNDTMTHVERCRKAIDNDYSDFQKSADGGEQDTSNNQVTSESTQGPSTSRAVPSKDTTGPTAYLVSPSRKVWGKPTSREVMGAPPPEPDSVKGTKARGRPKRRDPYDRNTIQPIPEKKLKLSTSTENATNLETSQSSEKILENQPGPSCSDTSNKSQAVPCNKHSSDQGNQPGPSCSDTSNKSQALPCNKDSSDQGNDIPKKKEEIPKKPALFTLNPLCIPIDLLKFKQLVSSDVTFKPIMRNYQMVQRIVPKENKARMKKEERKKSESEVELICVDEKQDVIRREKYISIIREEHGN